MHAVAWTLTDLAKRNKPGRDEVVVALAMRRQQSRGDVAAPAHVAGGEAGPH